MTWGMSAEPLFARHVTEQVVEAEAKRLIRWRRATDSYYGRYPDTLRVKPGKPNDNVKVNHGRLIVDKGTAFLFGQDITFEIDETKTTTEEEYLLKVWARNRRMTLLNTVATNGGIYGHTFIRILPATEGRRYPRLVALDPMTVNVKWDEDDIDLVLRFTITYNTLGDDNKPKTKRQRFERQDNGESWQIIEEEGSPDRSDEWRVIRTSTWAWPFPPIVHCQNLPAPNEFWGMADLEDDVIDMIQAGNFIYSNIRKIIRYHAHPKTWGKGFTAQQLKVDTDELIVLPNAEASLQNLEMSGDLGSSLEFARKLTEALFLVTRIPEVALGRLDSVGALSGVALRLVFQPLIDKTEAKRRLYGEMLELLNSILLVLGGFRDDVDAVDVKTTWPELLPKDMMEERQALQIDRELGVVSLLTVSSKLNYDYKTEQERRQDDPPPPALPEQPGPASAAATPREAAV